MHTSRLGRLVSTVVAALVVAGLLAVAPQAASAADNRSYRPSGSPEVPGLSRHVEASCAGDGADGNRVQALYIDVQGTEPRFADRAGVVRDRLGDVDDVYAVSSRQTGGGRRVRWVSDPTTCEPVVKSVTLSRAAVDGDFKAFKQGLADAGYGDAGRHYLAFGDYRVAGIRCGQADTPKTQTEAKTAFDGGAAQAAFVNLGECNSARYAAHELTHTLGAVMPTAPNYDGDGHCTDGRDLICYAPGTATDGLPVDNTICPDGNLMLDCNNDDYFHTNPRSGSYLDLNWNVARSSFLDTVTPLRWGPTATRVEAPTSALTGAPIRLSGQTDGTEIRWSTTDPYCQIATIDARNADAICGLSSTGDITFVARATAGDVYTETTHVVAVTKAPQPTATLIAPSTMEPGSVDLSAETKATGATTYEWVLTMGKDICSFNRTDTPQVTLTCPKSYAGSQVEPRVFVTQADTQKSLAGTRRINVVAPAPWSFTLDGATSIIAGQSATVTAASNQPVESVRWWVNNASCTVTGTSTTATVSCDRAARTSVTVTAEATLPTGETKTITRILGVALDFPATLSTNSTPTTNGYAGTTLTVGTDDSTNPIRGTKWSISQEACRHSETSTSLTLWCPADVSGSVTVAAATTNAAGATKTLTRTIPVENRTAPAMTSAASATHLDQAGTDTVSFDLRTTSGAAYKTVIGLTGPTATQSRVATLSPTSPSRFDVTKAQAGTYSINAGAPAITVGTHTLALKGAVTVSQAAPVMLSATQASLRATMTVGGKPVAGQPVVLWSRRVGSGWSAWSTTTNASGVATATRDRVATDYLWRFPGNSTLRTADSATRRVSPPAPTSIAVTTKAGTRKTASMKVVLRSGTAKVKNAQVIVEYKAAGKGYKRYGAVKRTNSSGAFNVTFKRTATRYFRYRYVTNTTYSGSTSKTIKITKRR